MSTQKTRIHVALASLLIVLCWLSLTAAAPVGEPSDKSSGLLDLPMEDLMKVEIVSTAALTKTQARLVPAAVTTITREQIQGSSARSLFELLDIYVPNLQWTRNNWEAQNLGLRGSINDRDDKYLLLVNGRVMNEHTHYGAVSERDLVTLRDINHIDVIRGSGSALYGPGAISMVINIVTDNASTYEGTEVFARAGAVEEFSEVEFKHGQKWQDGDGGLFLYAGVGSYTGAAWDKSPQKFSVNFPNGPQVDYDTTPSMPCDGLQAGQAAPESVVSRDGAQAPGSSPIKLHAQVTKGNWDIWARYTRGGQQFDHEVGSLIRTPYGWGNWAPQPLANHFYAYQQGTGFVGYKKPLSDTLTLDAAVSYTMTDNEVYILNSIADAYREDDYYAKAMLQWQPQEQHKIAFGTEWLDGEYGYKSLRYEDIPARSAQFSTMPRWSTKLYSLLGEWQWTINDQWTTFAGGRLDKNTFTDWMISPRVAVAFAPTHRDTFKWIWSRSGRAPLAEDMKKQDLAGGGHSRPETLSTAEFRYERQQSRNLDFAASVFWHYDFDLISWGTDGGGSTAHVGTQKDYGAELEASYHTEKTRLTLSHGYTKLYDFDLAPGMWTFISAKAFGYGDDLTSWSNHVTKLTVQHKLDDQWTFDGSMRVYWGFPGLKDYATYRNPTSASQSSVDPNYGPLYRGNYYLNLGLQYKPSEQLTVGLMGYYLLGILDEDLNKRNDGAGCGYRDHAPALSLWANYKFR